MAEKQSNTISHFVEGTEFAWKLDEGLLEIGGGASLALWIESSLAGLMQGMQRMVGTERFNLAMQSGGRDSVEDDWAFISQSPSFEEGFDALNGLAWPCGWGRWSIVSLDRGDKRGVFRTVNGWESLYQRALGVCWGSSVMAGKFSGLSARLFGTDCWSIQTKFQANGDPYDEFVVTPSTKTLEMQLDELLATDQATRADLAVALEQLKRENAIRVAAEAKAQRLIEQQQRDLERLSTPVLQLWDGVLALPLLGTLTSGRTSNFMELLLTAIQRSSTKFAILDVTGIHDIDTHTADHLLRVTRTVRLLGARCIITGVQPAVAQTMVSLQTDLEGLMTFATLRDGLKYCMTALDSEFGR